MVQLRHGYFPQVFVWRGCWYDVDGVERCWSMGRRGLRGRVDRACFRVRVRCRSGESGARRTLEICQNVLDGSWHVLRQKV